MYNNYLIFWKIEKKKKKKKKELKLTPKDLYKPKWLFGSLDRLL
jgi:hypothetical protein